MTAVVVAGSTGLVGRAVLRALAMPARPEIDVTGLVRRPGALADASGVRELVFDYDAPEAYQRLGAEVPCDALICCLGTTLRQAGSPEAFLKVDRDYPLALLARAAASPHPPAFGLVSSVGADRPRGLYLRAKAAVEEALRASGLRGVIVRPSLLVGERAEARPAERAGLAVARPLFALLAAATGRAGWVGRFAPVTAVDVAAALVEETLRLAAIPEAGPSSQQVVVRQGWALRSGSDPEA